MSKIFTRLALILLATSLVGCKKDNDLAPGFDMIYQEQFGIPAGLSDFVVHHFYFENIPSRYATLLAENGKTDAEIKAILTVESELSGVFGDANFEFLEEVSVRVFPEGKPNSYLEFAYRYPVPLNPGNQLPIIPGLADVKTYLKEERFGIDLALRLRRPTPDATDAKLSVRFRASY